MQKSQNPINTPVQPVIKPAPIYQPVQNSNQMNCNQEQRLMCVAKQLAAQGYIANGIFTNNINPSLRSYIQSTSQLNIQAIYQGLMKMFNLVQ